MTDDDYKPTSFGALLVATELTRRGHDPETIMEKAQEICERNNREAEEQEAREQAERNILDTVMRQWQGIEFARFRYLKESTSDDGNVCIYLTAAELRAAFGRDNPLIAAFEKRKE